MYRLDPHFSNELWRTIFTDMAIAGVRHILFIPGNLLSLQHLAASQIKVWLARLYREPLSFAGYKRSYKVFATLFKDIFAYEELTLGGTPSYWLYRLRP